MRGLVRNKTPFYYALYDHKEQLIDEYGNPVGEYTVYYDKPSKCYGNISAGYGLAQTQEFGESVACDKVIVVCDTNLPIDEYSVLWIDTPPDIDAKGYATSPHDYIVKKVAKRLNVVSIAISRVNVSG